MNEVVVACLASIPAILTGWTAYVAAKRGSLRDLAADRESVLAAARERAEIATTQREEDRAKLFGLETKFDRLRSVLRRVVDALDLIEPDHKALDEAREALEELAL